MPQSIFRKSLLAATIAAVFAANAWADSDRVAELERRVAELEAMVESLVEQREDAGARAGQAAERTAGEARLAREQAESARADVEALTQRAAPVLAAAEDNALKPEFYYGGYAKTDFIVSTFDDGEVSGESIGRDFLVPSTIPVGGDSSTVFDAHARQTRFHLGTRHTVNGHELGSFIQFDFLVTGGGNERVSNSFAPRMRHAYLTWDNWLVGQTWNTFMDVATLPESVDFIGPTSGTSFGRTPMIRYTSGGFAVALENPETTVTPVGGGRIETDENTLPELAARYTWKGDWGHFQLGGMLRQLEIDNRASGLDDTEVGFGISASGKFVLGRDDLRWMAIYGDGMGRHLALNFVNDAALTDGGSLRSIETVSGFIAYRHWWSEKWRSTVAAGYIGADNPVQFTGQGVNESSWNAQLNLFYSPVAPLSIGLEYMIAEREIENGSRGQLNRVQFTTKYAF